MPQQTIIIQHLKDELQNVPPKIRDWFNSEQITDRIINLNKELGLGSKIEPGPKFKPASEKAAIIPLLLLRLQVKDLEPQNFTQELSSQLNIDYETAKSIAREIKKQILEPISHALLRWEVDINRIAVGGLLDLTEIKLPTIKRETEVKPIEQQLEAAPKPIEITDLPKTAQLPKTEVQPPKIEPVIPPKPISAEQPFIIHQETEAKAVIEKKTTGLPTLGWFKKESSKTPESPIKVELETFGPKIEEKKEPVVAKTEAPKQRIIHYREVEIPTPFGKTPASAEASAGRQGRPEGQTQKETPPQKIETPVVKQEPPKPTTPATPTVPAAKPEQSAKPTEPAVINLDSFGAMAENKTQNEVKLEGNTINLKNNKQLQ